MQRARTICPPALLCKLYGVPDYVTMPSKVGTEITFQAHGHTFRCYRHSGDSWSLSVPLISPRVRFGNAQEIAKDIGSVLETGTLPGKSGTP